MLRKQFTDWRDQANPDAATRNAGAAAYRQLCGNRVPSPLENILPEGSAFRAKLYPPNGAFRDPVTGFCCALEVDPQDPNHFFLCIPGTGRGNAWSAQLKLDGLQFIGAGHDLPPAYRQAEALFEALKKLIVAPKKLSVTGHSLGGGIASFIGCKHPDVSSVCYNAAALGARLQTHLTHHLNGRKADNVTHIQIAGDPVSSPGAQKRLRSVAAFLTGGKTSKITLPVDFGTRYRVPRSMISAAKRNPLSRHRLHAVADLYPASDSRRPAIAGAVPKS